MRDPGNAMWDLYEFEIGLKSPFLTPWQADTLFGELAWVWREATDEASFLQWLDEWIEGHPPFVLSDGWSKDVFPRPLVPVNKWKAEKKRERIQQARLGKAWKKVRYLKREAFLRLLQGNSLSERSEESAADSRMERRIVLRNVIDRDSGRSLAESGLYEQEEIYMNDQRDNLTLSIFARVRDQSALAHLGQLFRVLSWQGHGKKRSVGYGQFCIRQVQKRDDLDAALAKANGVVWLSGGVPRPGDPTVGLFQLDTKYGKLGNVYASSGYAFKRPLTRILPGAVFETDEPRPFYGGMVKGISPQHPSVVQYGYALAVPIILRTALREEPV